MTVVDANHPGTQPHPDSMAGPLTPEQQAEVNRIAGTEVSGEIDTEGEVVGAELGGLALGVGEAADFGTTGADVSQNLTNIPREVAERIGAAEITPVVASYVRDTEAGRIGLVGVDERLTGRRQSDGRVVTNFGDKVRDESGAPIYEKRPQVNTEQAKLVKESLLERKEAREVARKAEEAQSRVRATVAFLDDAIKGRIDSVGLQERLTGRRQSDGRVVNSFGEKVIGSSRAPIYEKRVQITAEQADIVTTTVTERVGSIEAQKRSDSTVQEFIDTTSYLSDVLSGRIDSVGLQERLTGRRQSDGRVVNSFGEKVISSSRAAIYEQRGVVPDSQAQLVQQTLREIELAYKALPEQVQQAMPRTVLSSVRLNSQLEIARAVRDASMVPADIERSDATITQLEALLNISERIELSKRLSKCIKGGDVSEIKLMIEQASITSIEDRDFIRTQFRPALSARLISDAAKKVNGGALLSDETIKELANILPSSERDASDIQTLTTFALRRLLVQDYAGVVKDLRPEKLQYNDRIAALRNLSLRPSTPGFDYVAERSKLIGITRDVLVLGRSAEIRKAFASKAEGTGALIESILDLPLETPEDMALQEGLIESLAVYLIARRTERPDDFTALFSELTEQVRGRLKPEFPSIELGRNLEASKMLAGRFKDVIAPIFQSLRSTERTSQIEDYIRSKQGYGVGRESYVISLERLEKQRPLTAIERDYLASVEALSIFNPHLTALASEAPEVTQVVLESHFEKLSAQTKEGLQDGDYVPLLLVGLGPNGITALGEMTRLYPELAGQILAVDDGELPGGPFAVPRGTAWDLNSANERGSEEPTLPDSPEQISEVTGNAEQQTVRAYGSPLPWYPGERAGSGDVRPGSINTTVDFLPTPDDLSDRRYPTNDELALVLQLQAAMLLDKVALRTEVVRVEPAVPEEGQRGDKIVTLRLREEGQEDREVRVRTDAVVIASGLGRPNYGFEVEGSRAQNVLAATANQPTTEFPLLTDTLGAFRALAKREGDVRVLGDTLVIYGAGNSTDTLIEYIGGLFADADNPTTRNVKKIYVVTEGDLSARPRYAQIRDLRSRNGRDNLVEFVSGRVNDVALSEDGKTATLLDVNGRPIRNKEGGTLTAPSIIAATGFRSDVQTILAPFLQDGERLRDGGGIQPLTLPTNPDVSVADIVERDPSIVLVGTASRPDFQNPDKLLQLPPDAREALIRNGAENAVAIGFRRPDDQAAMRIFIPKQERLRAIRSESSPAIPVEVLLGASPEDERGASKSTPMVVAKVADIPLPGVRRDVPSDSLVLSPLLLQGLGRIRLTGGETTELGFEVRKAKNSDDEDIIECEYKNGTQERLSPELTEQLMAALSSPYFVAYWLQASSTRRVRDGLAVELAFRNGRLDLKRTFAEPI